MGSDYDDDHKVAWSPNQQYSVSSDEGAEDALVSPGTPGENYRHEDDDDMEDVTSEEDRKYDDDRHYKDTDLSVFREIVNEDRNYH